VARRVGDATLLRGPRVPSTFHVMSRRTTPQSKTDDLAFPVRLKIAVPGYGLGRESTRMTIWLRENIGVGNFAQGSTPTIGGSAHAIYFLEPADALCFREAFPDLALADGTQSPAYSSPSRNPVHRSRTKEGRT